MGWVDTHCHLQLARHPPETLLARAAAVDWVVVPGVDLASSMQALSLAERHSGRVLATAGLHPHDASLWPEQGVELTDLAKGAAAVGETGLDFYRDLSPRPAQVESLRAQIDLAADLDLPLVLHCRDAFDDLHRILEETGAGNRSILHCWTGGRRWTRRFLELGCWFSFAGPITYDTGETIRLAAELVPPARSLVETDAPFLTPEPHRGEDNEPAWVSLVGEALARVWGMEPSEVAAHTSANAASVFLR